MHKLTRRSFLHAGSAAVAATAFAPSRVLGANERVNMGFIGIGGRGMASVNWFDKLEDVNIAALCDPDEARVNRAQDSLAKKEGGKKADKTFTDLRKLIEDDSIDAVCISTQNHWHALAAIWACQAGKDVYVEKPVSHNIWEGRKLVEAARKYNRVVQGGTQQRSNAFHAELRDYLADGPLGKIKSVRCNRYGMRGSIGKRDTPLPKPDGVDYDLWLGPAQDVEIFRNKLHYDWHWDFNCGNGELGNWGPHILDDLRNLVFRDKLAYPTRVLAGGGRLAWNDAGESPNTHFIYMDCDGIPVIMDVHNLPRQKGLKASDVYRKRRTNAFLVVECENGYYAGGRSGGSAHDPEGKSIKKFKGDGGGGHARNFIDAVKARDPDVLNAEIEQIHYSSAWCHLGNISWQLGEAHNKEYCRDRAKASLDLEPWHEVLEEFHTHLDANEVNWLKEDVVLGKMLEIDAEKETFTGESATDEALALLKREYRKGFEVPEKV